MVEGVERDPERENTSMLDRALAQHDRVSGQGVTATVGVEQERRIWRRGVFQRWKGSEGGEVGKQEWE